MESFQISAIGDVNFCQMLDESFTLFLFID